MTTLVRARHVITMAVPDLIDDGAVAIDGTDIVAVGDWTRLRDRYRDAAVIGDGTGIVTPGLVNAHGHFSEAFLAGRADGLTLLEWKQAVLATAGDQTREIARLGTMLRAAEMAQSGVTTVADMFVCAPDPAQPVTPGVVDGLAAVGLRGDLSYGAKDGDGIGIGDLMAEHEALRDACVGSDRVRFRMGISNVISAGPDLIRHSAREAREAGLPIHMHLEEVREEVTWCRTRWGVTPVRHVADLGVFESDVLAAHVVWADQDDMRILADAKAAVAHNPVSNAILGSGVCPLDSYAAHGVPIGLGTDGAASNDRQDMLEVIKVGALLQKIHRLQAGAVGAHECLRMATLGGARALGLGDLTGSLEPGKRADVVLFTRESPRMAFASDPCLAVVYAASPADVSDVWVDGERVVADGSVRTVDTREVIAEARRVLDGGEPHR